MKKPPKKGKKGGAKRKPTKAQLLGLAKGQEKLGRHEAAAKLRARANGTANPSKGGKSKGNGGASKGGASKGPKKPRTPKAPAPAPAAAESPAKKGGKGGSKRKGYSITLHPVGKDGKRVKATLGALNKATKKYGRYLDLRTGQIKKPSQIGRTSNPSLGSSGIVAMGAGVLSGAGVAVVLHRYLLTRPTAYNDSKQKAAWYGRSAMLRINAHANNCAWFVSGLGVVVSGAGFLAMGSMPVLGAFAFGFGLSHVAVGVVQLTLNLIGKMESQGPDAKSFATRIAPEYVTEIEAEYRGAIKAMDEAATAEEDKADGGDNTVSGTREDIRERLRKRREEHAHRTQGRGLSGHVKEQIEQAHKQALAGLDSPPAVAGGCDGSCSPGHTCGPDCCNHKQDRPAMAGTGDTPPPAAPPKELPPASPKVNLPPPRQPAIAQRSPWGNLANARNPWAA